MFTDELALTWLKPLFRGTRFHSCSASLRILLRLFQDRLVNERHLGVRFCRRRNAYRHLIPHPLADGREVEELPGDGKVVDEGCAASRRMSFVSPVTVFQDRGAEKIDLNHLACHAIDLYPVADTDSVLAHQNEPAEKSEDETLQSYREPGRRETQDGRDLAGYTERDQQDTHHANQLHTEPQDRAQRLHAPPIKLA